MPTVNIGMFTCPICGSHYWGTSFARDKRGGGFRIVKDIEDAVGICNGWYMGDGNYTKCHFAWNRNEDEWVFHPRPEIEPHAEGIDK